MGVVGQPVEPADSAEATSNPKPPSKRARGQHDLVLGSGKTGRGGKVAADLPPLEWLEEALAYPGVQLLDLTVPILVESTQLPGSFHRDPADQIIVATARLYNIPLLTEDSKILSYPHVQKL